MAYILGLIFADGYIGQRTISIILQNQDQYLLKQVLKKIIMPNEKIWLGNRNNAKVMCISSIEMVKDIVKIFKKDKKYLRRKLPVIPKKYLPDFMRGLWDGDGCVRWDKVAKGYRSHLSSGSLVFLEQIKDVLQQYNSCIKGRIDRMERCQGTPICGHFLKKDCVNYQLSLGINDTRRLRDFMYSTPSKLRMTRKYKKFLDAGKICLAPKDRRAIYWKFYIARKYVRQLNMKSLKEWEKYCIANKKPENIPSAPHLIYREWSGYRDWLGYADKKQ
jgi:hypothetical protein